LSEANLENSNDIRGTINIMLMNFFPRCVNLNKIFFFRGIEF
jgi:hypothetical protein